MSGHLIQEAERMMVWMRNRLYPLVLAESKLELFDLSAQTLRFIFGELDLEVFRVEVCFERGKVF